MDDLVVKIDVCVICLEKDPNYRLRNCEHIFHKNCIDQCKQALCPLCKVSTEVLPPSFLDLFCPCLSFRQRNKLERLLLILAKLLQFKPFSASSAVSASHHHQES